MSQPSDERGTMDALPMEWLRNIRAVLFDMDGTLLDSEPLTHMAVQALLDRYEITTDVDCTRFHGVTWKGIADALRALAPALANVSIETELHQHFHTALVQNPPPAIPGAPAAVRAASRRLQTAVVSSSDRESIDHVVQQLNLSDHVHQIVSAEDCQRSKPDPECFQLAAQRLGVTPETCLVFEDSIAGLTAARAAGMKAIAIGPHPDKTALANQVIDHFDALPTDFFDVLGAE